MNQMMFTLSDEEDEGKIPLLIILAVENTILQDDMEKYIDELLHRNHPRRVQEVMRMSLSILRQLESFCVSFTKLRSSRGLGLSEKIAIFINILGHGASNREVQEHFQHSGSTVSLCFQEVLAPMLILHKKYVH